ncbi:MAG: FG-GAP-like repeat-containing protein [Anaerolineae bacterium]|jgi:hypothetical protein
MTAQDDSGTGQRLASTGVSGWEVTHAVALGDIDGDGDTDAVFGGALFGGVGSFDTVWVNDGAGRFRLYAEHRLKPGGDDFFGQSEAVRLGDLDRDGDLDAFVGNTRFVNPDGVWFNDGHGQFTDSGQRLGDGQHRCGPGRRGR